MSILYGFPVTEARRRVPRFYKLQKMQEPPSEVARRQRVAGQQRLVETAGNGFRRAKRFELAARRSNKSPYPKLADLGL